MLKSNIKNQLLDCLICKLPNNATNTIIIYAHGLGSNKLQIVPILKKTQSLQYDIISFDFSANGKSQGTQCTFGIKQKQDIAAIISYLDKNYTYDNYILWGRSMGAVSIVLQQSEIKLLNQPNKVRGVILDSPFSSFQKIAIQMAHKKSIFPEFIFASLIGKLKNYFKSNKVYNPFDIELKKNIQKIKTNILFIYSKNDSVIHYQHSTKLMKECKKVPFYFQIQQDHNASRNKETISRIMLFINDFIKQNQRKNRNSLKSKGINLTPRSSKIQLFPNLLKIGSKRSSFSKPNSIKSSNSKQEIIKYRNSLNSTASQQKYQNQCKYKYKYKNQNQNQNFILQIQNLDKKYNSTQIISRSLSLQNQQYKRAKVKALENSSKKSLNIYTRFRQIEKQASQINKLARNCQNSKTKRKVYYQKVQTQQYFQINDTKVKYFKNQGKNNAIRPTINLMRKSRLYPF